MAIHNKLLLTQAQRFFVFESESLKKMSQKQFGSVPLQTIQLCIIYLPPRDAYYQ